VARRVLLLFCLLASAARAQVSVRATVGTFAARPTVCSAGHLYATSNTGFIYKGGPANTWTTVPNLNPVDSFTGHNTHSGK
jgi:hypothetical protein